MIFIIYFMALYNARVMIKSKEIKFPSQVLVSYFIIPKKDLKDIVHFRYFQFIFRLKTKCVSPLKLISL